MRLTNEMRNDFANAVIRKIPVKSDWNLEKIITEIERRLFNTLTQDVKDFATKYPNLINRTSFAIEWLNFKRDDGLWSYGRVNGVVSCNLASIDVDDLKRHWRDFMEERRDRKELRGRIYQQALACSTLAQLQLMFPDLKGLMPKDVKVIKHPLVPAKSLVDDLVKVGLEIPQ